MYTKASFLKTLALEAKILKHLAGQVPAGQEDWRLSPPQRSTTELLRYLSFSLLAATEFALTQAWDRWELHEAGAKDLTVAGFAKAMDRQVAGIKRLLAKLDDGSLKRRSAKDWNGTRMTLGQALVEMVLKPAVAYRMQLFLHAKASGAAHLATSDCWRGKPAKAKAGAG